MTVSVWRTKEIRELYKLLLSTEVNGKRFGRYNRNWNTYRPLELTRTESDEIMEVIFNKLINTKGLFPKKKPKSVKAVWMQLLHCITKTNSENFYGVRNKNRMIAYTVGFIKMADIVYLETEHDEKMEVILDYQ